MAAIAFAFSVGAASAEEISGTISEIGSEAQTLTLDNGMTFSVSEEVSLDSLSAGDEVNVTYEEDDGQRMATEVSRPEN